MFALLILPILISGFIVLSINPYYKLKLYRYNGQLLYLKAAKIGFRYFIFVTILSFMLKDQIITIVFFTTEQGVPFTFEPALVTIVAKKIAELQNNKISYFELLNISWLITLSVLTIALAYLYSWLKCFILYLKEKVAIYIFTRKTNIVRISMLGEILKDSPIDYMFYQSLSQFKPILITLGSKKVYIGIINKLGEPSESEAPNQEISLVPLISGYRNKDTLKVVFENNYVIPPEFDSSIIIKVDEIETVSWFTQQVYENVNGNLSEECQAITPSEQGETIIKLGKYHINKSSKK